MVHPFPPEASAPHKQTEPHLTAGEMPLFGDTTNGKTMCIADAARWNHSTAIKVHLTCGIIFDTWGWRPIVTLCTSVRQHTDCAVHTYAAVNVNKNLLYICRRRRELRRS